MKNFLLAVLTLGLLAVPLPAEELQAELQAPKNTSYLGDYTIDVTLGTPIPIQDLSTRLFSVQYTNSMEVVPVKAVTTRGGPEEESTNLWRRVILLGDFSPNIGYLLTVHYPGGSVERTLVDTSGLSEPVDESAVLAKLKSRTRFEIEPIIGEEADLGLKYDLGIDLKRFSFGSLTNPSPSALNFKMSSRGELSFDEESENIQNSLRGGLEGMFIKNFRVPVSVGGRIYSYAYPIGIKVKPAEFEADRDFDNLDFTAKLLAGGSIPLMDYPALAWANLWSIETPFFPPTLFVGYTRAEEISEEARSNELGSDRIDLEFLYFFPVAQMADLQIAYNLYHGLGNEGTEHNFEAGAVFYLSKERSSGISVTYQDGALPPLFEQTSGWRVGFRTVF